MANSTTNIDEIQSGQATKEITANAFFDAASPAATYGRRASTSSALTWGYYGGSVVVSAGTTSAIANDTVALTGSATNYIVASKATGAVSVSTATTNWDDTANYWRLYSVVTGVSSVSSWTDARVPGRYLGADGAIAALGLGTMATQNASAVAITGGTINGATVGATTPATGAFTTLSASGLATLSAGATVPAGQLLQFAGGDVTHLAEFGGSYAITNTGLVTNGNIVINAKSTASVLLQTGASTIAQVSSTGVSITGNLTTTSKLGVLGAGAVPTASALEIGTNGVGSRWSYNVPSGGEHDFTENGTLLSWQNINFHGWLIGGVERMRIDSSGNVLVTGTGGLGYGTGSGGSVTQGTSRTTGVTLNKTNGAITLVSAAGSASWQTFTVTNSTVAATDLIDVAQKSGTDIYLIHVTAVAAGSFNITFATTGGTTVEQPVFTFSVKKGATA